MSGHRQAGSPTRRHVQAALSRSDPPFRTSGSLREMRDGFSGKRGCEAEPRFRRFPRGMSLFAETRCSMRWCVARLRDISKRMGSSGMMGSRFFAYSYAATSALRKGGVDGRCDRTGTDRPWSPYAEEIVVKEMAGYPALSNGVQYRRGNTVLKIGMSNAAWRRGSGKTTMGRPLHGAIRNTCGEARNRAGVLSASCLDEAPARVA